VTDIRIPERTGLWALILALVLSAGHAYAEPQFPTLTGRVVDGADILTAAVKNALTGKLEAHENATTNQVVVVTLPSLQGYAIEEFGYQLLRHWGIGQEDRNNGVLLIVAPNERKVRIEVGYGLEGSLTDALSKTIIETEILPRFRKGDYSAGIVKGTEAILAAIAGTYKPKKLRTKSDWDDIESFLPFIFFIGVLLVLLVWGQRSEGRAGWYTDDSFGGSSDGGGFGGGGGGGGGGGFSGGGGGGGGGGASGSW